MANEAALADHLRTTPGQDEVLPGPPDRPGWKDAGRAKADELYGSRVVDFIGEDKPWGGIGRVAIQRFRLDEPCVYFIGGSVGAIKIGQTISPLERLATFQLGSPIKLSILALDRGGPEREREYHRQFANHRLHGEWFERHDALMDVINDLFFFHQPGRG